MFAYIALFSLKSKVPQAIFTIESAMKYGMRTPSSHIYTQVKALPGNIYDLLHEMRKKRKKKKKKASSVHSSWEMKTPHVGIFQCSFSWKPSVIRKPKLEGFTEGFSRRFRSVIFFFLPFIPLL
ncbi:hypothetical protein CEXT_715421 [Caerostris extrusa]|uniref:Uncharacterized protein n=1 Tax=Caerostris extrusa TaxID=172846 RepID=A0AAV4X3R9_CAEEX|nr:hypothetical protein CEXT_715421 [Caerostris extrusa]